MKYFKKRGDFYFFLQCLFLWKMGYPQPAQANEVHGVAITMDAQTPVLGKKSILS